jgi:hypothetical protein
LQQLVLATLGLPSYGNAAADTTVLVGVTLLLTALSVQRLARAG